MSPRFSSAGAATLLFLAWLTSLLRPAAAQFVFNQVTGNLPFDYTSPQVVVPANLNDTVSTQQFTLWGWIRPRVAVLAISNVVQLQNVRGTNATDALYFNFLFNGLNATSNASSYSLMFLNPVGFDASTGNPNMLVTGFENLTYTNNSWIFWAVSCDYAAGNLAIYVDDLASGVSLSSVHSISFPAFDLFPGFNLIVGSVMNNSYFVSTSGFVGDIGYIDLGLFYTTAFQSLWMGFMSLDIYPALGFLLDLNFDLHAATSPTSVAGTGLDGRSFPVMGSFFAAYASNPATTALGLDSSGWVNLGYIDFRATQDVFSIPLYFHFAYQEPMADPFVLFEIGNAGSPGFLQAALAKVPSSSARVLQLTVQGANQAVWKSSLQLFPGVTYRLITGIAVNPRGDIFNLFYDQSSGTSDLSQLLTQDRFPTLASSCSLLSPRNALNSSSSGNFTLFRFSILGSASSVVSAVFAPQFTTANATAAAAFKACPLKSTFYGDCRGCLRAQSGMLTLPSYSLATYCPSGSKNATTDVCVPCLYPNCSDIVSTAFKVTQISTTAYRAQTSLPVSNFTALLGQTAIALTNLTSGTYYNYSLAPNPTGQYVDITFSVQGDISNGFLQLNYTPSSNATATATPIYDAHANIVPAFMSETPLPAFCSLTPATETSMKALAWTVVAWFFLSALLLVLVTLFCWSRLTDAGALWKQLVHVVIKVQFVACVSLLSVTLPCALQSFLSPLYYISVSWAHGFGLVINRTFWASPGYQAGYVQRPAPSQFSAQGAYAFFLHNMMVPFIIHGFVFTVYLACKLLDCIPFPKHRLFYRFLVFLEFSGMVGCFGVTLVPFGVFSLLDFRLAVWSHPYFVFAFLAALAYLLVFVLFVAYAVFRLAIRQRLLSNPTLFNRLYYFSAGYKKLVAPRTYDIWLYVAYFTCAAAIGGLYDQALAQMVLLVAVLAGLLLLTLLLRPAKYLLQTLFDVLTQFVLLVVIAMLLALAASDFRGCPTCIDRQGVFAYVLVALLFVYCVLLIGQFIFQILAMTGCYQWYAQLGKTRHECEDGEAEAVAAGVEVQTPDKHDYVEFDAGESNNNALNDFKSFKNSSKVYLATSSHQVGQIRIEDDPARDAEVQAFQTNWEKQALPAPANQLAHDSTHDYNLAFAEQPGEELKEDCVDDLTFEEATHRTLQDDDPGFMAHQDVRRLQLKDFEDDSYVSAVEMRPVHQPMRPFQPPN